jgi:pimeloyl-ACP methyl ester carboxylesterase
VDRLEIVRIPAARPGMPALVFLHEGLGSAGLWRDFPSRLAARTGCGAVVYSRAGNGFSPVLDGPRRAGYMHDEALRELPRLLAALAIDDALLVGHSDGASIALIFAAEHSGAIRGLVLEAPHLFVEDVSIASIAGIRERYETTDLGRRMKRHHADAERTFYGWNDVWLSPEFRDWNIESFASRVRVPVLAVQGTADEYGTLDQLERLASLAPRVDRLVLADCGHAPHRDRPLVVEGAIAAWVEERVAPNSSDDPDNARLAGRRSETP